MNTTCNCGDKGCKYNENGNCVSESMKQTGICYSEYTEEMQRQGM